MTDWSYLAACRDHPEVDFFAGWPDSRAALAICETCPVRAECLAWAVANRQEYGVWGGTVPTARRRLIRGVHSDPPPIRHGTTVGAKAHRRRGEQPCPACLRAAAEHRRWTRPSRARRRAAT